MVTIVLYIYDYDIYYITQTFPPVNDMHTKIT